MFIKMLLLLFPRSCLPSSGTGWVRELREGERTRPRPRHRRRGPSTSGPPRTGHPSPQERRWGRTEPPHPLPVGPRGWEPAAPSLEPPLRVSFQAFRLCKLPGQGMPPSVSRGGEKVRSQGCVSGSRQLGRASPVGGVGASGANPPGQGCSQALTWPSARAMPSMMPPPSRNPAFCRMKWPRVPSPGPRSASGSMSARAT